jgi:hypothetical protein
MGEAVEFQDPPEDLKEAIQVILSYNIPLDRFATLIAHAKQ